MTETYPIQRESINSGTDVRALKDQWPFLFAACHLLDHASKLLGFSVQNQLAQVCFYCCYCYAAALSVGSQIKISYSLNNCTQ